MITPSAYGLCIRASRRKAAALVAAGCKALQSFVLSSHALTGTRTDGQATRAMAGVLTPYPDLSAPNGQGDAAYRPFPRAGYCYDGNIFSLGSLSGKVRAETEAWLNEVLDSKRNIFSSGGTV